MINATAGDISTPAPNMTGGGNISDIFNQAVAYWEMVFPDPDQEWTLNLTYNWGNPGEGVVAQFKAVVVDATANRILSGAITFNNSATIGWFADPNPEIMMGNPAFGPEPVVTNDRFQATSGEVVLNIGLVFVADSDSPAYGRSDLLTIGMHEIGHGLGLLNNPSPPNPPPNYEFTNPIVVDEAVSPVYAGMQIDTEVGEHLFSPSLMEPRTTVGTRVFASSRDILAMAQISQYFGVELNPYNVPNLPVPEPSGVFLSLAGLSGIALVRRRRR